MIFIFRVFVFFLCCTSLYASRWPTQIIPAQHSLFSLQNSKKLVFFSQKMLKKKIHGDQKNFVFNAQEIQKMFDDYERVVGSIFQQALLQVHNSRPSVVVKVLLEEMDDSSSVIAWKFACEKGFECLLGDKKMRKVMRYKTVTVVSKKGSFFCNGKKINFPIKLRSISGHGEFNGVSYDGDFVLYPQGKSLLCINYVGVEDYIISVLRTESWPGWPLEVNKVFAIACRSYVVSKVIEGRKTKRPFHVRNTNVHQTYRGRHEVALLKQAVDHTRGKVLGFKGEPILAMFDCCCGGIVPAHIDNFDFKKAPYLARDYACNYCSTSSLYSWQVDYEHARFEQLLKNEYKELRGLHDIAIIKKDKAGLVGEVQLRGPHHNATISGKKLYSLLKEIKSFHFDVSISKHRNKNDRKIVFTGRGYGHHLGLCQWGARQMVREGFNYKSILKFYYPNTYFMQLS